MVTEAPTPPGGPGQPRTASSSRPPGGAQFAPPPPPPPPPPPVANQTKPSAHWPLTIVAFLFSLVTGGIGMYFSAQVGSRWRSGDIKGANKASKTALILGIVGIVVPILLFAVAASSGSGGGTTGYAY